MDAATIVILGASGVASLVCEVFLWRGEGSLLRKLVWTVLVLLPVFGPFFYGGLYRAPSVQDPVDRAFNSTSDIPPDPHS